MIRTVLITGLLMLLAVSLFTSCNKDNRKKDEANLGEVKDSINYRKTFRLTERLNPQAQEMVKDWPEYRKVANFINDLKSTEATRILSYSDELARLSQELRDSTQIETFQSPDYKIRLNVIDNEARRLLDMSTIPTISSKEVFDEYQRFIDAFSALNSKLNNEANKSKIDDELRQFIAGAVKDTQNIQNTESYTAKPYPHILPKAPPQNRTPQNVEIKKGNNSILQGSKNLKVLPVKKKEKHNK